MAEPSQRLTGEEFALAVIMAVMVVLNFASVVARYWLKISLPWISEIEVGLFLWTVFLGAGLTIVRDIHLGFSAIVDKLPAGAQRASLLAGRAVFLVFFALLTWFGVRMVLNEAANGQTTPTLGWPEWLISAAIPVGAVLAAGRIASWFARNRRP